jgi:hypothetical protein
MTTGTATQRDRSAYYFNFDLLHVLLVNIYVPRDNKGSYQDQTKEFYKVLWTNVYE